MKTLKSIHKGSKIYAVTDISRLEYAVFENSIDIIEREVFKKDKDYIYVNGDMNIDISNCSDDDNIIDSMETGQLWFTDITKAVEYIDDAAKKIRCEWDRINDSIGLMLVKAELMKKKADGCTVIHLPNRYHDDVNIIQDESDGNRYHLYPGSAYYIREITDPVSGNITAIDPEGGDMIGIGNKIDGKTVVSITVENSRYCFVTVRKEKLDGVIDIVETSTKGKWLICDGVLGTSVTNHKITGLELADGKRIDINKSKTGSGLKVKKIIYDDDDGWTVLCESAVKPTCFSREVLGVSKMRSKAR